MTPSATAPASAAPPAATPAAVAPAADTPAQLEVVPPAFSFADVERKARELAGGAYAMSEPQVPDFLRNLKSPQWERIRFKPEQALWRGKGQTFEARFFHPGFIFNRAVSINIVADGKSEKLVFSPDMFDYGPDFPLDRMKQTPMDFAGFRLLYPYQASGVREEVVSFIGATYFRSLGKNAAYGIFARGLALNTALPGGEEFPYFREFWLVQAPPDADSFTVYALMDSPSMSGAYSFLITPGTSVTMDVECRLFMRKGVARPKKIGVAPLTSMFFYSETGNGNPDDYRPEVHNSDGLLLHSDENLFWRPLSNPARLAVNTFASRNPRGFGLLQRDSNFDHYQDIEARFERRSSLWVEPKGDWGPGHVELIEIPTRGEIHNNIDVFWVPSTLGAAEGNGAAEEDEDGNARYPGSLSYSYRLYWMASGVTPHELGQVVATRMARVQQEDAVRFYIDFEGEALKALPADTGLASEIETPDQAPLLEKQLTKNPVTGGWRLSFKVRVPRQEGMVQTIINARDGSSRLRFKAFLKRGENLPAPLTEVWVYDLPS